MTHRKPRTSQVGRKAAQLGMLAIACTAGIATTASPAGATSSARTVTRDVGIAMDEAHAKATPRNRFDYDEEFAIRELGTRIGVGARNKAVARSVGCSLDNPCRSVALSFQIVTTNGTLTRLNATNTSRAVNDHCEGCQTFAGCLPVHRLHPVLVHPEPLDQERTRPTGEAAGRTGAESRSGPRRQGPRRLPRRRGRDPASAGAGRRTAQREREPVGHLHAHGHHAAAHRLGPSGRSGRTGASGPVPNLDDSRLGDPFPEPGVGPRLHRLPEG